MPENEANAQALTDRSASTSSEADAILIKAFDAFAADPSLHLAQYLGSSAEKVHASWWQALGLSETWRDDLAQHGQALYFNQWVFRAFKWDHLKFPKTFSPEQTFLITLQSSDSKFFIALGLQALGALEALVLKVYRDQLQIYFSDLELNQIASLWRSPKRKPRCALSSKTLAEQALAAGLQSVNKVCAKDPIWQVMKVQFLRVPSSAPALPIHWPAIEQLERLKRFL